MSQIVKWIVTIAAVSALASVAQAQNKTILEQSNPTGNSLKQKERVIFSGRVVTKRWMKQILLEDGFTYVNHATCVDFGNCKAGALKSGLVKAPKNNTSDYLILVGNKEGTGTVGYLLLDRKCGNRPALQSAPLKGAAAGQPGVKNKIAPANDGRLGCLGGFIVPYRYIYDLDIAFYKSGACHDLKYSKLPSDSKCAKTGFQYQKFIAGQWRNTTYAEVYKYSTGLASISDGFVNGGIERLLNKQGDILHYDSWEGVTTPSSVGGDATSEVSVETACANWASVNSKYQPNLSALAQVFCKSAVGAIPTINIVIAEFEFPDVCEISEEAMADIEGNLEENLMSICLKDPSVTEIPGLGGSVTIDDIQAVHFKESEEIVARELTDEELNELCEQGTTVEIVPVLVGGKDCTVKLTRTCDADCSCTTKAEEPVCPTN